MRYALIRSLDINNGPGICASLYVQGCSHHCDGCFNPETWDFNGGEHFTRRTKFQFIEACKEENIKRICILGGEPLDQGKDMLDLIQELTEIGKPIWLWTGYTWEDIVPRTNIISQQSMDMSKSIKKWILKYCDVVIDGKFVEELKDKKLMYRGSSNQRVIKVKETLEQNKICLYEKAYK